LLLLVSKASLYLGFASPPTISNFSLSKASPQLMVVSDVGVTNQIQRATDLTQTNWVVLTNVLVAQSPYQFVDAAYISSTQCFYRIVAITAAGNAAPPGMALIPAGSFDMGDTFNEGESKYRSTPFM